MKTLTKEELPIGTKVVPHGKTRGMSFKECDSWNTPEAQKQGYLYVTRNDKDGYLALNELPNKKTGSHYNYSDVTIYEEKPKIKKKELKMEIEDLKEEVSNLRETLQAFIDEKNTVELEQKSEAEKPQFKVGKVYKDRKIMFHCTRVEDSEPYGFGFAIDGEWLEDDDNYWTGNFTEATPKEWFKRLEEYAKEKYPKGCKVKCLKGWTEEKLSEWYDNKPKFKYQESNNTLWILNINYFGICVMENGKWAEIIEEPQYEIGTLGIFWDGDFDERINSNCVYFGRLESVTEHGKFIRKKNMWLWENFKPIKFD